MKTLAALLFVAMPVTPHVTDPDYGCDIAKGYCVVKLEALQELMHAQKSRCGYNT